MSDPTGAIHARGLARSFGATVAVRPFDATIGPGGVTGLLGPNGSGKSTFLRMLMGLVRPDRGAASVDGAALAGDGTAVRRRATYLPGEIAAYGELSGRAHLDWLLRGRGKTALARAVALALELGLPLQRRVRGYSHGMKRQLFLAAALAPDMRVRVLDEPTEGLDPTKRGQVLALLRRDAEAGVTILLSSHHLGEVERSCDRVLFLRAGALLDEEKVADLHARARRAVHLAWPEPRDAGRLRAALEAEGAEEVRIADRTATLLLPAAEPHAALARLLQSREAGAPESVVLGRFSLQELYRVLYGAEGV